MNSTPYRGTDQVSIGNRSSISNQNSCTSLLLTPYGNFLLRQLLHVSLITRNLLSACQFYLDNFVFLEFNSSDFFVKDLYTQEVFLQGPIRNGLYVLPIDAKTMPLSSLNMHSLVKEPLHKYDIPVLVTLPYIPLPSPYGSTTTWSLPPPHHLPIWLVSKPSHMPSLTHCHLPAQLIIFNFYF